MGTKPRRRGRPASGKPRVKVACLLDKPQVDQLQALATHNGCSLAAIVRKALLTMLRTEKAA